MENNEVQTSITVTKVLDYLYCPRNIFYEDVLKIPKNEIKNFKVKEGKNIHNKKLIQNKKYLRKNINVVKKEMDITLSSKKNYLHGKLDELLFMEDGTMAPLDYKYSEFTGNIYSTYKYQLVMYSMMIEENYNVESKKGYIVFIRSDNKIVEISYTKEDFEKLKKIITDILKMIEKGIYPIEITETNKCTDCCYRKFCF